MACETMQVTSNGISTPKEGKEKVGKVTDSFIH